MNCHPQITQFYHGFDDDLTCADPKHTNSNLQSASTHDACDDVSELKLSKTGLIQSHRLCSSHCATLGPERLRLYNSWLSTLGEMENNNDGSNTISSPTILSLPPEILESILALAVQPDDKSEYGCPTKCMPTSPHKLLVQRLQFCFACKTFYHCALPAYFRHTRLDLVVRHFSPEIRRTVGEAGPGIICGTFQEHSLFLANVSRLRVEIDTHPTTNNQQMGIDKVCSVLRGCERLAELTVSDGRLTGQTTKNFMDAVHAAVEEIKKRTGRNVKIRRETPAEYDRECRLRRTAEWAMSGPYDRRYGGNYFDLQFGRFTLRIEQSQRENIWPFSRFFR